MNNEELENWRKVRQASGFVTIQQWSKNLFPSTWEGYTLTPLESGGFEVWRESTKTEQGVEWLASTRVQIYDAAFFMWRHCRSEYFTRGSGGATVADIVVLPAVSHEDVAAMGVEVKLYLSKSEVAAIANLLPTVMNARVLSNPGRTVVWEERAHFDVRALVIEAARQLGLIADASAAVLVKSFKDSREPKMEELAKQNPLGWRLEKKLRCTLRHLVKADGTVILSEAGYVLRTRYGYPLIK